MMTAESDRHVENKHSMFVPRPSSSRSQDIRHILSSVFHNYFSENGVTSYTIENLMHSQGECDDDYHNFYVSSLKQIYDEHEKDMEQAAMLERHIMQAQARAMSADERKINQSKEAYADYDELGLPQHTSVFSSCLDKALLDKHGLLIPSDYIRLPDIIVPPPKKPTSPCYTRETQRSIKRITETMKAKLKDVDDESLESRSYNLSSSDIIIEKQKRKKPSEAANLIQKAADHHMWKGQISQEQRTLNKGDLSLVEAKVNYLKNTRFDIPTPRQTLVEHKVKSGKEIGIVPIPERKGSHRQAKVFVPSPSVVVFSDYTFGQIYQQTLKLKNVTKVLRSCRVIPPETPYFHVDYGFFPSDDGLVASGMSCVYTISFSPDSLADYDDVLTVQSQSVSDLKIRLQGRRKPPIITLPRILDLGHSLVGGKKILQIYMKNKGGPGKFCVLPMSLWPATSFKSRITNTFLSVGAFEIRPSVFELRKNQSGILEIVFSPKQDLVYTENVLIVCDNCQIADFTLTGTGETAQVQLQHTDSYDRLDEPDDENNLYTIQFDSLIPFTYIDRKITVFNKSNCSLQYKWIMYKTSMAPAVGYLAPTDDPSGVIDLNSVFGIYPQEGTLRPNDITVFKLTFAPPIVSHFQNMIHLVLTDLPNPAYSDGLSESSLLLNQATDQQCCDHHVLGIDLKGQSEEIKVILKPYALIIPGKVTISNAIKRFISMENYSIGMIRFTWELYNLDHVVDVEPQVGELGPNMGMDFEVKITGVYPGQFKHNLCCFIDNVDSPLILPMSVDFKGPEISIDNADLHFGLVHLGSAVVRHFRITNRSQFGCCFNVKEHHSDVFPELHGTPSSFTFFPSNGDLPPFGNSIINVRYEPLSVGEIHCIFEVQVKDGNNVYLNVFADVQVSKVCLETCELEGEEIYLNQPKPLKAVLINQTYIPTKFHWGQPEGTNTDDVNIEIVPTMGEIAGKDRINCTINIAAEKIVSINDLRIPCIIADGESPLYINIIATVKGLDILYAITSSREIPQGYDHNDLRVDFGGPIQLGRPSKAYLHLINNSPVLTTFSIDVGHFQGKITDTQPNQQSVFPSLLNKTPNLTERDCKSVSKENSDLQKSILSLNHGIALIPSVTNGYIEPLSHTIVELTAYSDMWGTYMDQLVVKVKTCSPQVIPIALTVIGCPLTFQALASNDSSTLNIRMGTHTAGVPAVKRAVRINNSGPCDIRLDWQVFALDPDSNRLLDIILYCGRSFPLKDEEGNIIVPPSNSLDSDIDVRCDRVLPPEGLAHVYIKKHDGIPSNRPFVIKPDQIIVPGHGHAIAHVWLIPSPVHEVEMLTSHLGYALGFLSLKSVDRDMPHTNRNDGYDVQPLRIELSAKISPALLSVNYTSDEQMTFRCCVSDIVKNPKAKDPYTNVTQKEASFTLSNDTQTPLTFTISIPQPFLLLECDLFPGLITENKTETESGTLYPRQTVMVKVAYRLNSDVLSYMDQQAHNSSHHTSSHNTDLFQYDPQISIAKDAIITFSTGITMGVPLTVFLYLPALHVSAESHDFGTCYIGQRREFSLTIDNRTSCTSYWKASFGNSSNTCIAETFMVYPTTGCLEAYKAHVSKSKCEITVYFTASHEERCEAVIFFTGLLGEEPRTVHVTGQGSYDQLHYAQLNK